MKIRLQLILTFAAATTFAQIPNSGFENWTTTGIYQTPDGWGTMNNTTDFAGVFTVTRGTPGSPGTAYMKLTSKTVSGIGVVNGMAVSGLLDSTTMQPMSGFPFSQRPTNLTGKWQHMIFGSSQGSVMVTLTRWDSLLNQRITVASANHILTGMAMSWANFSIPLSYSDAANPDTCIIFLRASGATPANNDYLWVDSLNFSMSTAAIEDHVSHNLSLQLYPNPSTGNITISLNLKTAEKIGIEISDLTGKLVFSEDTVPFPGEVRHTLDLSALRKGIYFIKLVSTSGTEIQRIVLE